MLTDSNAIRERTCMYLPYLTSPPPKGTWADLRDLRSLGILQAHVCNDLICALPWGAAAKPLQ